MNKILLTIGIIGLTVASAFAQGTIAFGNSALTRITTCDVNGGTRNVTASDNLTIGVWYGASADALVQAPGEARIGNTHGAMTGASSVFPLPGTEAGQVVSLQIRAWNDVGWYAQTDVRRVTLGPTAGPGAVIWQPATLTNPNRFTPLHMTAGLCIPEPSVFALGTLSGAFLLFRFRKTTKSN